jgi:hypothetical protein
MSPLTSRTALQMNAILAVVSVAAAAALMSLVLTQPEAVAAAVARHEYGAVVTAVARELTGWLHALLRFL